MGYLKNELTGFVPVEQATDIIKMVTRGSSVLRMAKVEEMKHEKKKFNVLTDGPGAYWVGEGERIKTSGATWIHPEIEAKKLAVIIPVTKEKLEDTTISVFEELKPEIAEAFYRAIDAACIFGTNSPFKTNIMNAIDSKHMVVTDNTNIDIAISDAMSMIEENGYDPSGFIGRIGVKNMLRKLRDANGAPAYVNGTTGGELYGQPIEFVRNGAWDNKRADIITGNFKYAVVGMRAGINYEILTEATLQGTLDSDGKPLSLAEQDMVAIKATMRLGFLVVKDDAFAAFKNGVPTTWRIGQLNRLQAQQATLLLRYRQSLSAVTSWFTRLPQAPLQVLRMTTICRSGQSLTTVTKSLRQTVTRLQLRKLPQTAKRESRAVPTL